MTYCREMIHTKNPMRERVKSWLLMWQGCLMVQQQDGSGKSILFYMSERKPLSKEELKVIEQGRVSHFQSFSLRQTKTDTRYLKKLQTGNTVVVVIVNKIKFVS